MGGILSQLKANTNQKSNCPLLNTSLSKLKEFHGSFKSICDNFSIGLTEFEQIFGANESSFVIWDTDNNGLIDALELFSGLVVFADAKFEDKIRFLFDLFDFNELNSLSPIDIEFMLHCSLISTFKIYSVSSEINDDDINKFVMSSFSEDLRINISQLLKWCSKTQEIHDFFAIIQKEAPSLKAQSVGAETNKMTFFEKYVKDRYKPKIQGAKKIFDSRGIGSVINSKKMQTRLDYLSNLITRTQTAHVYETGIQDVVAKLNWVYGFRCDDVKHPLKYFPAKGVRGTPEKLIYFTACIVVLLYPKSNEQLHYTEHEKEVISLAVSERSHLVATGELGDNPSIHVWDSENLQNIVVIRGIHERGVHLLAFIKNDEVIVSCGLRDNSPILVYSIKDSSLLLSTYVTGFVLELFTINSYIGEANSRTDNSTREFPIKEEQQGKPPDDSFLIATADSIIHYTLEDGQLYHVENTLKVVGIDSYLTCCYAMQINYQNPDMRAFANDQEKVNVVLTGHKNGSVYAWDNDQLRNVDEGSEDNPRGGEICKYKGEILCITSFDLGVIIVTDSSYLYLWDFELKKCIMEIDLCSLQMKLNSLKVTTVVAHQNKIYIATVEGDVLELIFSFKKEPFKSQSKYRFTAKRINNICKLNGNMKALTIMERPEDTIVYVAGDAAIVYAFSVENHDIVDVWGHSENITAMDCVSFEDGGTAFAFGSVSGKIHLRFDWEEYPRVFECGKQILDLKFSHDAGYLVSVSENSVVHIFTLINNSYFQNAPKKIAFDNECPISVNFSDDNKILLVGTSHRNHYTVDLSDLKHKNLNAETERIDFSYLDLRYPVHQKNFVASMLPVSFGKRMNGVVLGDEQGHIFLWKDKDTIVNNCGSYLKGHSALISRFIEARENPNFFSLGSADHTLLEWKIEPIIDENEFNQTEENKDDLNSKLNKDMELDDVILREFNFCFSMSSATERFKDSMVVVRGTTSKNLNTMLYDAVSAFDENNLLKKRIPPISVHLEHVFGFQAYERRKTLGYGFIQITSENRKEKKKKYSMRKLIDSGVSAFQSQKRQKGINLFQSMQNNMSKRAQSNKSLEIIPYDERYENGDRYFVYFISRIAIVYDPTKNQQQFYEGHRSKITAMTLHPSKSIIATGDASSSPMIHIWNMQNLEPLKIIKSYHRNGILNMAFSRDGSFIVSLGMDKYFSIQITNWKSDEVIAFRNTDSHPSADVIFNTYDKYEFATCGYQNISVWQIKGRSFIRKEWVMIRTDEEGEIPFFTCIAYINYQLGEAIESDLIVGNNLGALGIVTRGKYINVKPQAHSKMVNCIRVTDCIPERTLIFSAGEDEFVRVWDTSFNLLHEINIRKTGHYNDSSTVKSYITQSVAAQSIDVIVPKNTFKLLKQKDSSVSPLILIGTRNGDIIEGSLQMLLDDYDNEGFIKKTNQGGVTSGAAQKEEGEVSENNSELDEDDEEDEADRPRMQSKDFDRSPSVRRDKDASLYPLDLKSILYLRNHSGPVSASTAINYKKKVIFAIHPIYPIMITIGEDQRLCVWDTERFELLKSQDAGYNVTALKFIPDNGDMLALGFVTGRITIVNSKFIPNAHGSFNEHYTLPEFEVNQIVFDKDIKTLVLNIEFSARGDLMAVSYDNQNVVSDSDENKYEKEGAHVRIYVSRYSIKFTNFRNKENYLYYKYDDIKNPSLYETIQKKDESNVFGKAVYFMSFSTDDNYLLIYYQIIDSYQIRTNDDPQGTFVIWDLNSSSNVANNPESYKHIQWRKMNFPNNIHAQYIYYQLNPLDVAQTDDKKEAEAPLMKNPCFSAMCDMNPILITGSTTGELHLFKVNALHFDKDFLLENLNLDKMCYSKSIAGHVSFVNQLEVHKTGYFFTTGVHDECIMQWRYVEESPFWDLDFLEIDANKPDIFAEVLPKDKFANLIDKILPLRNEIKEYQQNIDELSEAELTLSLNAVLGRKAYNRRNNLFYDTNGRVITCVGSLITMLSPLSEEGEDFLDIGEVPLRQEFLQPDSETLFSVSPEISAFTLSDDRKFVCAGTIELYAKLVIWEISSRTCLKSIALTSCSTIQLIRFSHNAQHICCVGMSPKYSQMLFLVNAADSNTLACVNLTNTLPYKIKDISFCYGSVSKFVTCGVQHMSLWRYAGNNLTFSSFQIENPKELEIKKASMMTYLQEGLKLGEENKEMGEKEIKEEEDIPILKCSFLCLTYVKEILVSGGDDGFIYIWKDDKIIRKQTTHSRFPILCIHSLPDSSKKNIMNPTNDALFVGLFVTGGMDGRIMVWEVTQNEDTSAITLEKYYEFSLVQALELDDYPLEAMVDPKLTVQIQSICMGSKSILFGTRSGDVYEIPRPTEEGLKDSENRAEAINNNRDKVIIRLNCNDQDIPKSVGFSINDERIYSITKGGIFSAYDRETLRRVFTKSFAKQTVAMLVFRRREHLLIAFDKEIIMLKTDKKNNYAFIPSYHMKYKKTIVDVKYSPNEVMIGVALDSDQQSNALIEVYDVVKSHNFSKLFSVEIPNSRVQFMDFSKKNDYLLYLDEANEITIIDMTNQNKIKAIQINTDYNWASDGIQISEKVKGIYSYYTNENKVTKIILAKDKKHLIVTDQMGTIRLFKYPCEHGSTLGYFRCYTEHLNYINNCVLSNNGEHLITTSEVDRSLFLWTVSSMYALEKDSGDEDGENA